MQQVKDYLSKNGIKKYGHANIDGCIQFMIKSVDRHLLIFTTDLQIRIYVSEDKGVSDIKPVLSTTAF